MSHPPERPGCWRSIGVEGDRSCPELTRVIHCRNCQVFSEGAASFFERPPPPGYVARWTEVLREEPAAAEDTSMASAVVFRVEDEWLGLPTKAAAFVAPEVSLRRLAGRSNRVFAGLGLFLGELALAVSLRGLLGLGPPRASQVRWLAMGPPPERWVFDIDELSGVIRYPEAARSGAPASRASVVTYLSGVIRTPDRTFGLLDPAALDGAFLRSLAGDP